MAVTVTTSTTTISDATSITNWSGSSASTGTYIIGYDPYTKKKRIMTDKHGRDLKPGQLIMTEYFEVGLIVNFTNGGNPRCIGYNELTEELRRYTYKPWNSAVIKKDIGDIVEPRAWTNYRGYILREAGDPRTVLPPGLVINKQPMAF